MSAAAEGLTETQKAVRLICKGLKPTASALRDSEYGSLLAHYRASPPFRDLVSEIASAMELRVLGTDERMIILGSVHAEGFFAPRMADMRRRIPNLHKGVLALATVAIAATFWPQGASFAPDVNPGTATAREFIQNLFAMCSALKQQHPDDPILVSAGLQEGWRYVLGIPSAVGGERASPRDLEGMMNLLLRMHFEEGLLDTVRVADDIAYVPTNRYAVQVREMASAEAAKMCLDVMQAKRAGYRPGLLDEDMEPRTET